MNTNALLSALPCLLTPECSYVASPLVFLFKKSKHSWTQEAVPLGPGLLWSGVISTASLPLLCASYRFHQYLLSVYSLLDTMLSRVSWICFPSSLGQGPCVPQSKHICLTLAYDLISKRATKGPDSPLQETKTRASTSTSNHMQILLRGKKWLWRPNHS